MDNLTPTPYKAGWDAGMAESRNTSRVASYYDPPTAFKSEYDQGWGDALTAWDVDHGADLIPDDELTGAQWAQLARIRAVRGPNWPPARAEEVSTP